MSNRRKAPRGPVRPVEQPPEIQAGAPLGVILTALSKVGWGPLAGHYYGATRGILMALAALLGASGQGYVTAAQVADSAGFSERWVRRKLAELEDSGLVVWDRGGVRAGRPTAGYLRVSKVALADMVNRAREAGNPKALARARETAARIAAAGLRWTKSKRGVRSSQSGSCGTRRQPSLLKKEDGGRVAARPVAGTLLSGPRPAVGSRFAAVRALMQQRAVAQPA